MYVLVFLYHGITSRRSTRVLEFLSAIPPGACTHCDTKHLWRVRSMRTMSAFKLVLRAALVAPLQDRDAALELSNDDLRATIELGLELE